MLLTSKFLERYTDFCLIFTHIFSDGVLKAVKVAGPHQDAITTKKVLN